MSKIVSSPQDSEMLDEYDFSRGIRGKYFSRYPNNNLPSLRGVRYLTDGQGRKTAALLDWQEHRQLWEQTLETINNPPEFSFLINPDGSKAAIFIDFKNHLEIWHIIYDQLVLELEG
jgi:hypothetical protein